ncbi:MFS transporter [Pseudoruegeria sp. SK021]|uniref:MFS transporter n=1 Tax=Pseudoruegeria sp. SK021 TaxID=1933035 RepID=UPI000A21BA2B|nr:MFS transporter [Pseudoruegeria sp. SK021]OSP56006.1 MFS transporter [Pseudoruegeria sp. SK021]
MVRYLLPISALLFGSALLLFAGGLNSLILPVRGSAEGFSAISLGLLGTGWACGYVAGCLITPRLVSRTGHIRAFGVMASFAAVSILGSLLLISPWAWIPLRAVTGFCFAGAAMIVESWLSERTEARSRGKIFGVYTMVNLLASTGGQMSITLGDIDGFFFFVVGGIIYCLALIPITISSSVSPNPLVSVSLNVPALWRNSPIAVFGVFMVGISNGSFGTLSAVYAERVALPLNSVALFASLPILVGALSQIPVGYLSDRMDRRKVLIGLAFMGMLADLIFILMRLDGTFQYLAAVSLYGASIFAMYPVILAHANDHAEDGTFIQTSGGLLMVFGLGCIVGPLIAGVGMSTIGVSGLFMTSLMAHVLMVLFALWRINVRAAVKGHSKGAFMHVPSIPTTTPEAATFTTPEPDESYGGSGNAS